MAVLIVAGCSLGVLLLAAVYALRSAVTNPLDPGVWALVFLFLSSIPYMVAAWKVQNLPWKKIRIIVFSITTVLRIAFLFAPFYFSDDVYRYWWEGRVQIAGINPYETAPDSKDLAYLRDHHWGKINHADLTTVYPPLLLHVFRIGSTIGHSPAIYKLIFTVFDLGVLIVLLRLLQQGGISKSYCLVWAWSPLVVLEFAGSAHCISMAIFFFLLGLSFPKAPVLAGASFALACLSHFLAIPAVIASACASDIRRIRLWFSFILISVVCYLGFTSAGTGLFEGLIHMSARWQFNGSLFEFIRVMLPNAGAIQLSENLWLSDYIPKMIGVIVLIAIFVWMRVKNYPSTKSGLYLIFALLLVSSTVHPWYVVWIVVLACFEVQASWLFLTSSVIISYVARVTQVQTGVWVELPFVRWVEYLPFYSLLAVQAFRKQFDSRQRAH